ncbi:BRCA1-A complex subunit BRE [Armadillidium vulgare]|nr:BRCA1-A complex subunit BRE [Armadillidium vulgare]RXG72989.1 BRCA1-A complex subunit BRE [Armadillidium vulgare]
MSIHKLSKTVSTIAKQINYMRINGFPGLSNDITGLNGSEELLKWKETNEVNAQSIDDISKYEEIDITLPYAGTNFSIRLLFNLYEPWVPPDMMFSDSKFMKKISVEDLEKMVPILNNWNYSSEETIAQLLKQLHQLYKNYQLKVLEEEELLLYEYKSVLQSLSIGEEDVEVSIYDNHLTTYYRD